MNRLKFLLVAAALSGALASYSAPPIEYTAAVRNSNGEVIANMAVNFRLDITDSPTEGNVIYSETQSATTDTTGMVCLMIGEGSNPTASFDGIAWDSPRFLSVNVDIDGSGHYLAMGTIQILGVPSAIQSATTTSLVRHSASGDAWELTVDNMGDLSWVRAESATPAYDQTKVPQQLFFIGTFNNWAIAEAVQMEKLSDTKFTIERYLEAGEIFKFTSERAWGGIDWSGTESKINVAVPLREYQNTPAFIGPSGTYQITVDFFNFTLKVSTK